MPIEEGAGCLAVILRAALGLAEGLVEWGHLGDGCGYIGSWMVRLLTLGRCKPDPESGWAIFLGILVLLGFVVFAVKMW